MTDFSDLPISRLLSAPFACACGQVHRADIRRVCIGQGALSRLEEFLSEQPVGERLLSRERDELLLVCDPNTRRVCGDALLSRLRGEGWRVRMHCFKQTMPHATKELAEELEADIRADTALLLAVGSGTINDLSRYASFSRGLPYYIIATAPSMDGFASAVSPLVADHLKQTYPAQCASCILGDTDLLATAPDYMLAAGLGDVLGKVWSIHDWKMSALLTGESYCPEIAALVGHAFERCKKSVPGLLRREPEALRQLMEALVLVGVAMAFAGNSRPASSGEHHIAHCLEMQAIFAGEYGKLHGINVGLGTLLMGAMYEKFLAAPKDQNAALAHADVFSWEDYRARVEFLYQKGAPAVLSLEEKERHHDPAATKTRIRAYFAHQDEVDAGIRSALEKLRGSKELLAGLGGAVDFSSYPHSPALWKALLRDAKEIRARYTGLQLMDDLGLLEEISAAVAAEFSA